MTTATNKSTTTTEADGKQNEEHVLHPELKAKLDTIRQKRAFNPKPWIEKICTEFNKYMTKCRLTACVVSISGGVDSACTLALMKYAAKMKNSSIKKVLAVSQPIHSSAWAYDRAHECAKILDAEIITIDQTKIFNQLKELIDEQLKIVGNQYAGGQLRSYMRAPSCYYVAQLLTQSGFPCLVMGTGNKDEDHYLAYFCKAGDGVVDIQLLADLHKSEVFCVARALGIPDSILDAKPSADLWDGQTDEDELGFTYDFIELWINYVEMNESDQKLFVTGFGEEAMKQFKEWGDKATCVHNKNKHKLCSPVNISVPL